MWAPATCLCTQHTSTMQMCVVVDVRDMDEICRSLLVAMVFLWDEPLECMLC